MVFANSSHNTTLAVSVGITVGALIGYNLAPNEKERAKYAVCGAIAFGIIGYLAVEKARANHLYEHCISEPDFMTCSSQTLKTGVQLLPQILTAISSAQAGNLSDSLSSLASLIGDKL